MDAEFFLGVWDTADGGAIIQVLGMHYIVHRKLLASGGVEYATGTGKVVVDGKYLGRERADKRKSGKVYVVMVQLVLLFGLDMWVVNPRLDKALAGFHHWAVHRMEDMGPEIQLKGTWVYPPIGTALETVGLE